MEELIAKRGPYFDQFSMKYDGALNGVKLTMQWMRDVVMPSKSHGTVDKPACAMNDTGGSFGSSINSSLIRWSAGS
ncbi:unnamed protein product [Soboliphyme baturini]|uniref:Uncharacterized protein n=1 Tax=Soboliphyme baturini TaxID=241478 RepID=A0A183ICT9_9BILA|nr:unnamed protein product [Soboliphyme baturini]